MTFIPSLYNTNNDDDEKRRKQLLLNQGANIMLSNAKGSELGFISKVINKYKIDDYYMKDIIPQDKEILSIQLIPYKVIYQDVSEWLLVVVYRKR